MVKEHSAVEELRVKLDEAFRVCREIVARNTFQMQLFNGHSLWLDEQPSAMRWVDVRSVDLEEGQQYIVRRVFWQTPEPTYMLPTIAVWTDQGWKASFGDMCPTANHCASIEVLCPRKKKAKTNKPSLSRSPKRRTIKKK